MRKVIGIVFGLCLTALAIANVCGVLPSDIVQRLDNLIYDVRLKAAAQQPVLDDRIVIVDIDEKSLAVVGRWPWSRAVVSRLVNRVLDDMGASVLAFDIVFAEPQVSDALAAYQAILTARPNLKKELFGLEDQLKAEFDSDAQFVEQLKNKRVVLGWYLNHQSNVVSGALPAPVFKKSDLGGASLDSTVWQGYGGNLPELQAAAAGGYFNSIADPDGIIRSIPILAELHGGFYQSLALATLRKALGDPQLIPIFPIGAGNAYGALASLQLSAPDLELSIPVERGLLNLITFRSEGGPTAGGYRYVSASDVLAGKVSPNLLKRRVVLVGTTAPGLMDLRSTPVNPAYPGVEVHANMLSAMLDGNYKVRPEYSTGVLLVSVVVLGVVLSVLLPLLPAMWALLVSIGVIAASVFINSLVYFYANQVYPVAVVLLLALGLFVFNVAYGYLAESRSKRQIVNLFGEYVAPELVAEMAENPSGYSMEGDSKILTVLFADVRGFTTISETLEPNVLREYINEYLTVMSEIIRAHRGTLDKYIGDAIMAFWGAPVPDQDHAMLATQAAMAMQLEAKRLSERFISRGLPPLVIGVGVNTGQMRVGDMGSKIRRAYTVIGDAVNLGARLEGVTKMYGVGVIVGEATMQACANFVFQEIDAVQVKGKNTSVRIYVPWGRQVDLPEDQLHLLALWHSTLQYFKRQQWGLALRGLDTLVALDGEQVLYRLYRQRIETFQTIPPPPDWDGIVQFETK